VKHWPPPLFEKQKWDEGRNNNELGKENRLAISMDILTKPILETAGTARMPICCCLWAKKQIHLHHHHSTIDDDPKSIAPMEKKMADIPSIAADERKKQCQRNNNSYRYRGAPVKQESDKIKVTATCLRSGFPSPYNREVTSVVRS